MLDHFFQTYDTIAPIFRRPVQLISRHVTKSLLIMHKKNAILTYLYCISKLWKNKCLYLLFVITHCLIWHKHVSAFDLNNK